MISYREAMATGLSIASDIDWRVANDYVELLIADRRCFAWEWLRRTPAYRRAWTERTKLPHEASSDFGLLGWIDPRFATPQARPIWSIGTDPRVLDGHLLGGCDMLEDLFDIRDVAPFVSVEIDRCGNEHWLISDGHWAIRLDLHDGTLLGGPALLEHRLQGTRSSRPKLDALRQFLALATTGALPQSLMPREQRAARWILELRVGDAMIEQVSQQEMARFLFGSAIAPRRWRLDSASYRLRIQRLVRIAQRRLAEPLAGPWFQ